MQKFSLRPRVEYHKNAVGRNKRDLSCAFAFALGCFFPSSSYLNKVQSIRQVSCLRLPKCLGLSGMREGAMRGRIFQVGLFRPVCGSGSTRHFNLR